MIKVNDCLNCRYAHLKGTMTKLYIVCDQNPKFKRNLPDDGGEINPYSCDKHKRKGEE